MKTPAHKGLHGKRYDVVVCGGGSAGIGAALAAARGGASVLLLERADTLGGTAVRGGVSVWEPGVGGEGPPREIYERLTRRSGAAGIYTLARHVCFGDDFPGGELLLDPARTYGDTLRRHGTRGLAAEPQRCRELWHGVSFDRTAYLDVVLAVLAETGHCDVLTGTSFAAVSLDGRRVASARLGNGDTVSAPWWIDATGDANLAVAAGCRTRLGREARAEFGEPGAPESPSPALNGATLIYEIEALEPGAPAVEPLPDGVPSGCWWRDCFPVASFSEQPGPSPRRLGVNMLPTMDGAEAWRLGADAARAECRRRVRAHWHDLQTRYAEFRGYRLAWIAPMLGVRESRRVVARYTLTELDLRAGLSGQAHDDIVAIADHAVDVHGAHGTGCGELTEPYGVPFRCLQPIDCDNLLVAGRAAGFSAIAASSCRLSRTMLQLGVAAGVAVASGVAGRKSRKSEVR